MLYLIVHVVNLCWLTLLNNALFNEHVIVALRILLSDEEVNEENIILQRSSCWSISCYWKWIVSTSFRQCLQERERVCNLYTTTALIEMYQILTGIVKYDIPYKKKKVSATGVTTCFLLKWIRIFVKVIKKVSGCAQCVY